MEPDKVKLPSVFSRIKKGTKIRFDRFDLQLFDDLLSSKIGTVYCKLDDCAIIDWDDGTTTKLSMKDINTMATIVFIE